MNRRGFLGFLLKALPASIAFPSVLLRFSTIPAIPRHWTVLTDQGRWWDVVERARAFMTYREYRTPIVSGYTRFYGWMEDKAGRVVAFVAQPTGRPNHYYLVRRLSERD